MIEDRIGISSWGSISPLGTDAATVWKAYQKPVSKIQFSSSLGALVAKLPEEEQQFITSLRTKDKNYKTLDKSVLLAMFSAQKALTLSPNRAKKVALNIGSSRGATGLFEQYFMQFVNTPSRRLPPLSSPSTTLGNISSWVAYHCGLPGFAFSHSVTCSTALHAILNGIAWLRSGMCTHFLAGGSEAALTPFTIAQMKAMRIYSNLTNSKFPCLALDVKKEKNTMLLGEGAACFQLEINPVNPVAFIDGIGFAQEKIPHATAISDKGAGFQQAMKMALDQAESSGIDAIVCHAPGTQKGDLAEIEAIEKVFNKNIPLLTSNKWKIGHTLGASGALSLEFALLMLENNEFIGVPYLDQSLPSKLSIKRIMVNAAGFGGNVVSIIVSNF